MPRYFFDVQSGGEDGSDARGADLMDERAARHEALKRAARAFEAGLADAGPGAVTVHVRERDRSLFVVRLEATITPADPRGDGIRPDQLNSGNDV